MREGQARIYIWEGQRSSAIPWFIEQTFQVPIISFCLVKKPVTFIDMNMISHVSLYTPGLYFRFAQEQENETKFTLKLDVFCRHRERKKKRWSRICSYFMSTNGGFLSNCEPKKHTERPNLREQIWWYSRAAKERSNGTYLLFLFWQKKRMNEDLTFAWVRAKEGGEWERVRVKAYIFKVQLETQNSDSHLVVRAIFETVRENETRGPV